MKTEIKINEVRELYEEREKLVSNIKPPAPDPAVWPPVGWLVHPDNPQLLYKVVDSELLRTELFGSPAKKAWILEAKKRLLVIDNLLTSYFYPSPKDEGMQRKTKSGFVTSLKTGIKRIIDQELIEKAMNDAKGEANDAITWEAKLNLTNYRGLDEEIQKTLSSAVLESPTTPVFEIVEKIES